MFPPDQRSMQKLFGFIYPESQQGATSTSVLIPCLHVAVFIPRVSC